MTLPAEEFISFGRLLAAAGREIILAHYRTVSRVEIKDDLSPVTLADRGAEEKMRGMIGDRYPDHGIIGEEFGAHQAEAEHTWVLDPIDGTRTFITGVPLFGSLIALCRHGRPILGIIDLPVLDQLFVGTGKWTTLNGKPARMREVRSLDAAVLLTTDHFAVGRYHDQCRFDSLATRVQLYRTWGDCFGYTLLASGFADIMIDPVMHTWDILALIPVIRGAGGVITGYDGGDPVGADAIVASHADLHGEVLAILHG